MKYYLIEIADTTDGVAKAITEKTTEDDVMMVYHQTLASARANKKCKSILAYVISGKGGYLVSEYWERKETPTEAVPTED